MLTKDLPALAFPGLDLDWKAFCEFYQQWQASGQCILSFLLGREASNLISVCFCGN